MRFDKLELNCRVERQTDKWIQKVTQVTYLKKTQHAWRCGSPRYKVSVLNTCGGCQP